MKHLKKFNNEQSLISYKKNNFITPHLYLNNQVKSFDYMSKYQLFDYISSTTTGKQYIDLGCKLLENTDNIQIDIKFSIHGNSNATDKQGTLLVSQLETSPYPGFVLRTNIDLSLNINSVEFCGKWVFNNNTQAKDGRYYYKNFLYRMYNTYYNNQLMNQILEDSIEINNIPEAQCHQMNTHLFCALNGSNQPFRWCVADLYYLRIYKGGKIIRNLIPVKKLLTNEVGLYDLENDHLYISQGDEPFVGTIL